MKHITTTGRRPAPRKSAYLSRSDTDTTNLSTKKVAERSTTATGAPTEQTTRAVQLEPLPFRRRDATGHLDPQYAADLRARSRTSAERHSEDTAFLKKSTPLTAPLADELGREAVMTMTSGEDQSAELQDLPLDLAEDVGGPFIPSTAREAAAAGGERNTTGATRERSRRR